VTQGWPRRGRSAASRSARPSKRRRGMLHRRGSPRRAVRRLRDGSTNTCRRSFRVEQPGRLPAEREEVYGMRACGVEPPGSRRSPPACRTGRRSRVRRSNSNRRWRPIGPRSRIQRPAPAERAPHNAGRALLLGGISVTCKVRPRQERQKLGEVVAR
jgi:hypothetical protein